MSPPVTTSEARLARRRTSASILLVLLLVVGVTMIAVLMASAPRGLALPTRSSDSCTLDDAPATAKPTLRAPLTLAQRRELIS